MSKNEQIEQDYLVNFLEYEKEITRKNNRLLDAIRKVKGKEFYQELLDVIKDSEGIYGLAELVSKPIGQYQDEGDLIPGIWVNQTENGGITGDSFFGTVCVRIKEKKYLKFYYSM